MTPLRYIMEEVANIAAYLSLSKFGSMQNGISTPSVETTIQNRLFSMPGMISSVIRSRSASRSVRFVEMMTWYTTQTPQVYKLTITETKFALLGPTDFSIVSP